jgi:hypothetical protein
MNRLQATSSPSRCFASIASLVAYMQQIDEQYVVRWSREPTHCSQAMERGGRPSDGRVTRPSLGPDRLASRSYWSALRTLG